jgi:hypothetical protein
MKAIIHADASVAWPCSRSYVVLDIRLFPELRNILEEAFEAAPEGAVYIGEESHRKAVMSQSG